METRGQHLEKKSVILYIAFTFLVIGGLVSSGAFGLSWGFLGRLLRWPTSSSVSTSPTNQQVRVVSEESVVIDVVDKASLAVVTVGVVQPPQTSSRVFQIDPFDPFAPFRQSPGTSVQPPSQTPEQDIGSGFVVSSDGLIVTNKHVVGDTSVKYKVFTKDNKSYDVQKIYRDPVNDLAILKIDASGLSVVTMGDSSKIKVGQLAIAIGTALGEFRSTVTTGVISGVGRGITAGGALDGSAERLDNVLQTSAAINPGNSGGPLLNSSGQVIGINVAVSAEGQNIGFALPINIVKDALTNFNQTGQFNRPYLGVRYKVVTRDVAVLNEIPEGAYIIDVVDGSPAAKVGIQPDDIITNVNSTRLIGDNAELSKVIANNKVGDVLHVTINRSGKTVNLSVTLGNQGDQ